MRDAGRLHERVLLQFNDLGRHQIIEYNSPVLAIADQFRILTQLENSLIENILGVRVQREQERVSGLYKCQFTLLD